MKKGLFITFEGGEGAGKSTLMENLFHSLKKEKRPVIQTRAPGGTPIGQEIRNLLLHGHQELGKRTELLLFLADRAQHVDELILPALEKGQIVLCDRFNDSTLAYQGGARALSKKAVIDLCHFACHGLKPNLTIYLDLDPRIGFKRNSAKVKDRIEAETLQFHEKIRRSFKQIAKKEPKRFFLIDASQTPSQVFQQAKERIDALLSSRR